MTLEEIATALGDGWAPHGKGKLVITKRLGRFELNVYFDGEAVYVQLREPLFVAVEGEDVKGYAYCFARRFPRVGEPLDDIRQALKLTRVELEEWLSALSEVTP
jgi:hypothetical protein